MAYFNSWSTWATGMRVDPSQVIIFTLIMALACFLATPLTHVLLKYEDDEMERAERRAANQGSAQDIPLVRRFIIPALSIAFFALLFFVGLRHF